MKHRIISVLLLVVLYWGTGCERRRVPEAEPEPQAVRFSPEVPRNLAQTVPFPERNPFTKEGVLLGRKLFYDPMLSGNNQISCASCHMQSKAFSDGTALSTSGASGKPLLRHAPALFNLAWMNGWFWDGGAKDIESLGFGPITHADEMDQDLNQLIQELENHPEYPRLFKLAFGIDKVESAYIVRALAQFQRILISANSRYDKYVRNEPGGTLTQPELEGLQLVRTKCGGCHGGNDFFTDFGYHNNGLDTAYSTAHEALEWARGRITRKTEDIGKYKTPSLRNVALTAPYMHDGRFRTLEEVLNHYTDGVKRSPSLSPLLLRNGAKPGLEISESEKQKIILFLQTLTDEDFVRNKAFSVPQ